MSSWLGLSIPRRRGHSEETTSKQEKLVKKVEPGSYLDLVFGGGEHFCGGRSCVRIQKFQKEELATWFSDITEKEKSEVQIVAECYASTMVNIATTFFSRTGDARIRTPIGDGVERRVMAWSVADCPKAQQRMEGWS